MGKETVLITGASSGFGFELAHIFAANGADLALVARREEVLHKLALELEDLYDTRSTIIPIDLSAQDAPSTIVRKLADREVVIDVLVNNAGFGARGPVAKLSWERQMAMLQVNVSSLTSLTRLLLPSMIERDRGGVLNVASIAAFIPGPHLAVYYASKAYVLSFTEALAEELSGTNVTVTCLAPGPAATGFGADSGMDDTLLFKVGVLEAKEVAEAGYRGYRRGKVLVIPGLLSKLVPLSVRFTPRSWARRLVRSLQA
jgi:short-subunit dehydrogenase